MNVVLRRLAVGANNCRFKVVAFLCWNSDKNVYRSRQQVSFNIRHLYFPFLMENLSIEILVYLT